jgi:hypothetical protein
MSDHYRIPVIAWITAASLAAAVLLAVVIHRHPPEAAFSGERHLSAAPVLSATLGKSDNPRLLCVTVLSDAEKDSKVYCTDFRNVHVYADAKDGTYADVNYHLALVSPDPFGVANGLLPYAFTDFVTVHVQTEKEREQWVGSMARWEKSLYGPRPVPLDVPEKK